MTSPAMGTITFSERFCIMEKIFAFHPCGVLPTSFAIVPTFSFTSPNIVDRFPLMAPIKIPFIHSLIASSMLCIGYTCGLSEKPCKLRYKEHTNQGNAAARHELFHTQIGVGNRLDGGRRRVKKYLWSFLRTAPAGQVRL